MTELTPPPGYRIITAEEAEELFSVSDEVAFPYEDFTDEQEIRLYEGDLRVAGDLEPDSDGDWVLFNMIVDGDLVVDGTLMWSDWSCGNFVLVTGDLRARNVVLLGCPDVAVRGDLVVSGGVVGKDGDNGGVLTVGGRTQAQMIINTTYFNMSFGTQPEAVLIGDPYSTSCPVDFTSRELKAILRPKLLKDDSMDTWKVVEALSAGRPVLRPDVLPSHKAVLEELDALSERAAEVTTLDLSNRKLRRLPDQLFAFGNLRALSLAGNTDIDELELRIGDLASLEELNLSGIGLRSLPATIGQLTNLRVLDISGNRLERLPDAIRHLTRLEVLRAKRLKCAVPGFLDRLVSLREVNLSGLQPGEYNEQVDFPRAVTRLRGLKSLDLSHVWLSSIPDDLLKLTELEELALRGSLSAGIERLPDLAKLPRLRVLRLSGNTPWIFQPEPSQDLLAGVWDITTLEHLEIDRWGEKIDEGEVLRPALTSLADDAFARMPGLRRLDLSFNELTELPESFFALRRLETVDVRYTKLTKAALRRLRTTFPQVKMDLRDVETTTEPDDDDPTWQAVHALVETGAAALADGERREAVRVFEEALTHCVPGAAFSAYDRLYALYGLIDALGHLADSADDDRPALVEKLIGYAEQALSLVPDTIWHYTDEGAFQEEVLRQAGNGLAWHLLQAGDLERALTTVERALQVAEGPEHDPIRDTQVRILLAMGRTEEAYVIVDRVLTRAPGFRDFADLAASPDFQRWRGGKLSFD
ncbi:leucine-rich repeat domain-containing protein [Spongiactinospora rosea]|nr:leucine-rich repeat domain-containing protein [Spongiactinospora rosea]